MRRGWHHRAACSRCSTTSTGTCPRSRPSSPTRTPPAPPATSSAATSRCSARCPAETVARLRALPDARWLRGNGERWTANPGDAPEGEPVQGAIAASRAALGEELVAELGALPESVELGEGTRAWHGSPKSDVQSFLPEAQETDDELLEGVTERRLIFGHTHLPFRREHHGASSW